MFDSRDNQYASGIFRVRKTWFGKCILQEWQNYPNIDVREWKDVSFCTAPTQLKSEELSPR